MGSREFTMNRHEFNKLLLDALPDLPKDAVLDYCDMDSDEDPNVCFILKSMEFIGDCDDQDTIKIKDGKVEGM